MRGYHLADPSLTLHRRLDSWALPTGLRGILRSEPLPDWLALKQIHVESKDLGEAPITKRCCL
jgi:hypothetical protein